MRSGLRLYPLCAAFGVFACAPAQHPALTGLVALPVASSSVPSVPAKAATDHAVARSAVHDTVTQGLGMFLRRVEFEDQPVFVGGKFHGFRVAGLRDPEFWNGVDLMPGDVVTSVNGFPIEHPEQAQTAFDSLEVASELRVALERSGRPRELVYTIVDR